MSIKRLLLQAIYHCNIWPLPPRRNLDLEEPSTAAVAPVHTGRIEPVKGAASACHCLRHLFMQPVYPQIADQVCCPRPTRLCLACGRLPEVSPDPVYDPPVPLGPAVWPVLDSSNSDPNRLGQVWSRTSSFPEQFHSFYVLLFVWNSITHHFLAFQKH